MFFAQSIGRLLENESENIIKLIHYAHHNKVLIEQTTRHKEEDILPFRFLVTAENEPCAKQMFMAVY